MVSAVQPEILSTGCNAGFVRPDALLVVVVIGGTQDTLSPGTPASWYNALVTAKGGNEEAVVVLVISDEVNNPDGPCPYQGPTPNPLQVLVNTAVHGRFLPVCVDDYGPFLKEGAALALEQCAVLVPQ